MGLEYSEAGNKIAYFPLIIVSDIRYHILNMLKFLILLNMQISPFIFLLLFIVGFKLKLQIFVYLFILKLFYVYRNFKK